MIHLTQDDDLYLAPITTVNFANGNTLNTGDVLDGNGGTNTLEAELINDAFATGIEGAVRPTTENIQNVIINAIETDGNNTVTLNAANMTDIENLWSKDSNANLVIQDITTLTSDDVARNTEELTFRMDHASNYSTGPDSDQVQVSVLLHPAGFSKTRFFHFLFTALLSLDLEHSIVFMNYEVPCRSRVPEKPFPYYVVPEDDAWTLYFCIDKVLQQAFPDEVFDTREVWGEPCEFCGQSPHD